MAGVAAMAAVIEDFEATQPCKKLKKDDDPPPTRTITNYFMPLTRGVEKPFSPPRSNNIMDYFRKTSPAQEKPGKNSSQKYSPLQSTESSVCQEGCVKSGKAQRQKRPGKFKEQNKLQKEQHDVLTDSCAVMETPTEHLVKGGGCICVPGNDTAALLSQISDIILDEEPLKTKNTETCVNDRTVKDVLPSYKGKTLDNPTQEGVNIGNDDASTREDKCRGGKSVVRKSKKSKASRSELCNAEHEQSLRDASLEVHVDETSILNCSTITVSFEDFLQSQKEEEDTAVPESDTSAVDALSITKNGSDMVFEAPQLSPRTLTVLAEVHPISPNHESAKGSELRIASIFSKTKKECQVKNLKTSSTNPLVSVDVLPDLKRKSNVVVQEEDLELFVVEASNSPKCTKEERKQFMNAFKQPSQDGAKGKSIKGSGTLKQAQEKVPETNEKEPGEKTAENMPDVTISQSMEPEDPSSVGKNGNKSVKKSRKDSSEDVSLPTPKQEELSTSVEMGMESGCTDEGNRRTARELRRSSRQHTCRQTTAVPKRDPSSCKTRSQKKAEGSAVSQEHPAQASTPRTHRPKKGVYRAEMLYPLDKRESPIRMKFTRLFPSSDTKAGEFEISSPLSVQESDSMKKRKRAKRLIQKAKALKQSKEAVAGEMSPVRRSVRSKESVKINYCEDEDSVVFLEDDLSSIAPTSEESQKMVRSLNDVLGKKIPQSKASKKTTASKLGPLFLEKKLQRPSAVISIFDDSSCDSPENSQDDEQFRAKREFLKSGLPESFKKQMAKTAANREAYTKACTSFQPVVHVQQKLIDCSIWTLPWPESPLLHRLKEFYHLSSMPPVFLDRLANHPTLPVQITCRERVSVWQENFTETIRQLLLDKIATSNPSFPAQRFFTRFLKRHKDYSLQIPAEPEDGSNMAFSAGSNECVGGKRKRVYEEGRAGKQAKKQRSSHTAEEPIVISESPVSEHGGTGEAADTPTHRRGRKRQSRRSKQNEGEHKSVVLLTPEKIQCDSPVDSSTTGTVGAKDGVREDVLWTEKYQPQHSSDIIGNMASVGKVHSWLKEWKLRANREERRKRQEQKQGDDSNDSWLGDDGVEELAEDEDQLCNTLLITGPTGIGKTAAVYACAQELGFKVFEVNCSSQRSGRQILSQLKEATQSHQVDIQGVNTNKPTYFNSYSTWGNASKLGCSPRKVNSPRTVVSSPRKPPQSPRGATLRKRNLAPTSLASFFKMGGKPEARGAASQRHCPKKSANMAQVSCKSQEPDSQSSVEEQGKKTATSLILFEEVDVIFEDDSGFLAAVKTFMTTTKRPVILTTSDTTFSTVFDGYFDEIPFKAPTVDHVASYLQLLCLAENVRTDTRDLVDLLRWNSCDIRQSLLHLQFWSRSGGGHQVQQRISLAEAPEVEVKREAVEVENISSGRELHPASLPPCHTGCTESVLGLLNIQQEKTVEDLFRCEPTAVETLRSWDLLSETERRGVNLLYTNLEVLLPLPTRPLPEPTLDLQPGPNPDPQPGLLARHGSKVENDENTANMSPLKVSSRMRQKKQLYADHKNALNSDSESDEGFLSLPNPNCDAAGDHTLRPAQGQEPRASKAAPVRVMRVKLADTERKKSKPVSQCLSSLAEYLDYVSFMDSALHFQPRTAEGACRPQSFNWTGAAVKSGMTDEVCLESGGYTSAFDSKEIHAMLGSLSFWKCRAGISKAWTVAQELEEQIRKEAVEELTLPIASHRQNFSLAQSTLCEPRVMEVRRDVMSTVLTNRSFCTLGNRLAAVMDHLPSLRTICRSERLKEQGRVKRRFMHYFNTINLDLPKSTIQQLGSDFP
ncbi:ATPase family AAA domain-containing protein 5 [Electrophorus electricus]|uniref:ATPase family AAA domain-containing protein 5 n=1 Tax=Electrophorus electricus TaxID=8005 RepID=UPI0015D044A5|nr:ATPase family AAA domain-containing protein 5 [Electrophorus electricus]XP_035385381.1 ATPase family AAA domain-containing protein 5 [Electrophorus electricus]